MMAVFRYRKSLKPHVDDPNPHAPRIPIALVGAGAGFDSMGLIDSGSTDSVIPTDIAGILGLELGEKVPIITPGGTIHGYESKLMIEVPIRHNPVRLKIPCHILDDFEEIILGRAGFFEAFEITFCEADSLVRLKDVRSKKKWKT